MGKQEEKVEICARCKANPVYALKSAKSWGYKCRICLNCLEEAIDFLLGNSDNDQNE